MKISFVIWISIFLSVLSEIAECSCTFPSELSGTWYSAHKGALTFNSTHLTGYPIYMSFAVQSLDFECYEKSDRKYLLRATETALVFGQDIRGYLCIQLWRVSSTKYYYYLGTKISSTNSDNIYGTIDAIPVEFSTACNKEEPYNQTEFVVLVKDGEVSSGSAEATCPTDLLAKFSSVSVTDSTGSTSCTGSSLDVCTDRTELNYTVDASCASSLKFSSGGYWVCLHSIASGSSTFLAVWNNDSTVDGSTTYRFTCHVISVSGGTVYSTVFPNYCSDSGQTSTSVSSPGTIHVYSGITQTCYEEVLGGSSAVYYVTIILGGLFLISLVILIICLYKKGCCHAVAKKCRKRPISASSSYDDSVVEQGEQVTKPRFKAAKLKPIPGFKAKRPLRIGPIVEPSLEPLPKVEPLYAMIDPIKKHFLKSWMNAGSSDQQRSKTDLGSTLQSHGGRIQVDIDINVHEYGQHDLPVPQKATRARKLRFTRSFELQEGASVLTEELIGKAGNDLNEIITENIQYKPGGVSIADSLSDISRHSDSLNTQDRIENTKNFDAPNVKNKTILGEKSSENFAVCKYQDTEFTINGVDSGLLRALHVIQDDPYDDNHDNVAGCYSLPNKATCEDDKCKIHDTMGETMTAITEGTVSLRESRHADRSSRSATEDQQHGPQRTLTLTEQHDNRQRDMTATKDEDSTGNTETTKSEKSSIQQSEVVLADDKPKVVCTNVTYETEAKIVAHELQAKKKFIKLQRSSDKKQIRSEINKIQEPAIKRPSNTEPGCKTASKKKIYSRQTYNDALPKVRARDSKNKAK